MKVFITSALVCILNVFTYGQESFIKWSENRHLQWEDFLGKANDSSRFDAECFAEVRYQYKFYSTSNFEFNVMAHFDRASSWSKREKQSDDLLRHEQMHFDIAQLFAERLKHEFEHYNYTADFQAQITQIFNRAKSEYLDMQRQYDEETNHSLDKEKQREWESYIITQMNNTRLQFELANRTKKPTRQGI